MLQSPKYAISTAKSQQKVLTLETNTSQFDATSTIIQSMYLQIDELIETIKKRNPKYIKQQKTEENSMTYQDQLNMFKADEESTNLQQYYLAIESEEISNALYAQPNDVLLQQAQMKKTLQALQTKINQTKQTLSITENEYRELESKAQAIQEKQQNYASILLKLKEKQQINDSVNKLLDQVGQQQWLKLRQLFDVDMIKLSIPFEKLIRLQQLLLKESENLIQVGKHQCVLEEKKQFLIEIQLQSPLINLVLSFDQILLNIIHQPKDQLISKQGLLVQTVKCLNILHQNFCCIIQSLTKQNYSQKQFEESQKELMQVTAQAKAFSLNKTQLLIEIDKMKKQLKEVQQQLQNSQMTTDRNIENEVQNLLAMYLKDKEILMREIKFKYGKQYHDHMILDVKQEFKKICLGQQFEQTKKIEQAYNRMDEIQKQIIKNKDKIIELLKQLKEYKNTFQQSKTEESQIDKKEFLLQLQNLKIILLQLENKIQKKTQHNSEQLLQDLQVEINKLKEFIDQNFVVQKQRSDSIDTIKKTQKFEHGRSQSQIPIISTLGSEISGPIQSPKNIQYPVQNAQEIFDSSDDPIQIVKKPFSEWNSYQLSFNQNQLKSISGISGQEQSFITQKESSLHGSILEAMSSNRNKKPEIHLIVFLQLNESTKTYDPTKNEDPTKYGYRLYRIDNQFNIFSSEENENMNSYQKFERRLDVKQLILDDCSQNALKFRMIYEPSMRGIVQDSLALRHLNMQHLPFKLQGNTLIVNGLCLNEQDLIKLQLLFKQ
ncbi:unnamed protein product (macronuclear) [Paramecium tetraurelia]|uniref:Uncharacterized protein n=1 Tax=Paramecium tetraurelia TaxID=5888 RepID=A0CY21_PARTE|nr:uncharacterized protein GSPATT00011320001 [Paramecium tetraurelia]CAK75688.1 unnamed protein product [Paramecium tetraurelia]|eukprot:XP_001443085.1 hypothetical protein (macronuclear) [Paramecium tetraurelia strain d4-2]